MKMGSGVLNTKRCEVPKQELVVLYRQMADMTLPKCKACKIPLSCCSAEYCAMAIRVAKEDWNMELAVTSHPTLPLMGENGCTAAPHFRPLCTLHTCAISSLGFDIADFEWTDHYFKLRAEIDDLGG